jgi:hypothetical protein
VTEALLVVSVVGVTEATVPLLVAGFDEVFNVPLTPFGKKPPLVALGVFPYTM